mmetsp:Transcript_39322/g.62823  ORF Transcript_39322/g.62823 Transcript_39322/m.62823 type:complete len:217 (-) Transcript_39322:757-1407(-)
MVMQYQSFLVLVPVPVLFLLLLLVLVLFLHRDQLCSVNISVAVCHWRCLDTTHFCQYCHVHCLCFLFLTMHFVSFYSAMFPVLSLFLSLSELLRHCSAPLKIHSWSLFLLFLVLFLLLYFCLCLCLCHCHFLCQCQCQCLQRHCRRSPFHRIRRIQCMPVIRRYSQIRWLLAMEFLLLRPNDLHRRTQLRFSYHRQRACMRRRRGRHCLRYLCRTQ